MLTAVIAQWETAQKAALELADKLASETHASLQTAGVVPNASAWKNFTKTALNMSRHYADAMQAALDDGWRKERNQLQLKNAAASIKALTEIQTDLAARVTQGQTQHTSALTSATAEYLEGLERCRNLQDASMLAAKLLGDVHSQASAYAAHLCSLAVGVPAALVQWAENQLDSDDDTAGAA
ncbi:phasin family protein [Trinickia diaoshuihuensis]|jgi:hypothetical protein|uniref:phasin family protein n=1 Tax=Trinickia diaoshuihuensis TaxID=2292265 RepID=UPI000E27144C|nr:phasin family protein [Trinickia diaoshuihuensis]